MKIAITADGNGSSSQVATHFEECSYLLIIDMDDSSVSAIGNDDASQEPSGMRLVGEILRQGCEALITGALGPLSFDALADAGVTRYFGVGYSGQEALRHMELDSLEVIRGPEGGEGCGGSHHHE
jgi:predicted Fe-Mo cluster-binding NifX family protein